MSDELYTPSNIQRRGRTREEIRAVIREVLDTSQSEEETLRLLTNYWISDVNACIREFSREVY